MIVQMSKAVTTHLQPPPTLHQAQLYLHQPHPHCLYMHQNSSLPLFPHHYHLHPHSSLPSEPNTLLQSPLSITMKILPILSARHSTRIQRLVPQSPPNILPTQHTRPLPPLTRSPPNGPGCHLTQTLLLLYNQFPLQDLPPKLLHQNAKFLKMSGKL